MLSYISNLGRLGFVWQFITLGGLHANALATGKKADTIYSLNFYTNVHSP